MKIFLFGSKSCGKTAFVHALAGSFVTPSNPDDKVKHYLVKGACEMEIYEYPGFSNEVEADEVCRLARDTLRKCDALVYMETGSDRAPYETIVTSYLTDLYKLRKRDNPSLKSCIVKTKIDHKLPTITKNVLLLDGTFGKPYRISSHKLLIANMMLSKKETIPVGNVSIEGLQKIFTTAGVYITKEQKASIFDKKEISVRDIKIHEGLIPDYCELRGDRDGLVKFLQKDQVTNKKLNDDHGLSISICKNYSQVCKYLESLRPIEMPVNDLASYVFTNIFKAVHDCQTREFGYTLSACYFAIIREFFTGSDGKLVFQNKVNNFFKELYRDNPFQARDEKSCISIVLDITISTMIDEKLLLRVLQYPEVWTKNASVKVDDFRVVAYVIPKLNKGLNLILQKVIDSLPVYSPLRKCILLSLCSHEDLEELQFAGKLDMDPIMKVFGKQGVERFLFFRKHCKTDEGMPALFNTSLKPELNFAVKELMWH